jgi:outer membrane PBP1 activator LpoA protein
MKPATRRTIHDQGKQTPLLLVPRGALGDRVVTAFANEWLKLGGGTVLQQRLGSTAELRGSVNSGISLSGTPVSTLPSGRTAPWAARAMCRSAAPAASTPRISWPRRNKLPTSNR